MTTLRMTSRDGAGPAGPAVGRGYEVYDEDDAVVGRDRLTPGRSEDIAMVEVMPASVEERRALASPAFGLDRRVVLRSEGATVAVFDESEMLRAGSLPEEAGAEAIRMLERDRRVAWVCWEWLGDAGRQAVEVAISAPDLVPRPLAPPARAGGAVAGGGLRDRRTWLAVGAVLLLVAVVFASCG